MRQRYIITAIVPVVFALLLVAAPHARQGGVSGKAITLGVEGRSSAHVSLAARGKTVAAVWSASDDSTADIYIAMSGDGGVTFGAPRRVNDVAGDSGASGEQPPRVAIGPDAIHVVWPAKRGRNAIAYARSADGGATFARAVDVPAVGLKGARGWVSLAVDDRGVVHMLWLDGRASSASHVMPKPGAAHTAGATHADPQQDIYYATWRDAGHIREKRVAANVCFCCKTTLALAGGRVHAAWRQIFPGSIRDIAYARTSPAGSMFTAPARVSRDNWKLDGCPDDGPSVTITEKGATRIVWPTLVPGATPRKGIFYSSSADGVRFLPRVRLDAGDADPAHPQIAMTRDGATVAVWDELRQGTRRILMREIDAAGRPRAEVVLTAEGGIYPAVLSVGDGLVVAWTRQARGASVRQVQLVRR